MKSVNRLYYLFSLIIVSMAATLAFSNCSKVKFESSASTADTLEVVKNNEDFNDGDVLGDDEEEEVVDHDDGDCEDCHKDPKKECKKHKYCDRKKKDCKRGDHGHKHDEKKEAKEHDGHSCRDKKNDEEHGEKNKGCDFNGVKDVVVNIESLEIKGTGGKSVVLQGDLGKTSILDGEVQLSSSESVSALSVRMVLADSGNVLVDKDNKSVELKTPSAQQSGLKVPLSGIKKLEAKSVYRLKFVLEPESQIVHAGKKCILKPVLKFVSLDKN